jgi:polysaccharide export outer membrane protein
MHRCCIPLLLILFVVSAIAADAGAKAEIPKQLADYVQDARKLGLNDSDLRQNAIKAGWSADVVEKAVNESTLTKPVDTVKQDEPKPDRGVPDEYMIGAGDVLQVMVWKEPDASVSSVVVRADGKVTLPFLKEVNVSGYTPDKLEKVITERLRPFIKEAEVTVVVKETHSKKIYMVGAVKHEGIIELKYPMTVLQAISEAGGLTDFAKKKKISILRMVNGKEFRFAFNYDAVIKGQQVEQNILVVPDDTIVVLR